MPEITRTVEQLVADVDVDDDGYVRIHVTTPLTVDEARTVADAIIAAANTGERYLAEIDQPAEETVHGAPESSLAGTTCCGVSPFRLPSTDRITSDESDVTCGKAPAA